MKKHNLLLGALLSMAMVIPNAAVVAEERIVTDHEVSFHATITDAGQYVDRMTIDYGDDVILKEVPENAFTVKMSSTVGYGSLNGKPYPYYNADEPLEVVKTEIDGDTLTLYFNQTQAPTLTWLAEGRNYPGILNFTITQNADIEAVKLTSDRRELPETIKAAEHTYSYDSDVTGTELEDEEVKKFNGVAVDGGIDYQYHEGTNRALIVWFHGNGEGDFPVSATRNNVVQMLANRGTVAWATEEAQSIFGDATVMAFQAPSQWYEYKAQDLLTKAYNEIEAVIVAKGIDRNQVYVSGCSAGGFMTTRMLIAYPDLFKAAMISCPALDIANLRAGVDDAIPTDAEIASLKNSKTAIWLVQGETDSSVQPDDCSKRIWNILTEGQTVEKTTYDNGLSSSFTTYETIDDKYKLSLYETVDVVEKTGTLGDPIQAGMIVVAEDYDQDGVETQVKYNDHWTWVYTLRNNPMDAEGRHIWNWAASYGSLQQITGTNRVVVAGDDWGPGVYRTIVTLDQEVTDVNVTGVYETKEVSIWAPPFAHDVTTAARTVKKVSLSDKDGNPVEGASRYITVDMEISPDEGSPFIYDVPSGKNSWCDPYVLNVSGTVTTANGVYALNTGTPVDLSDPSQRVVPQVDGVWDTDNEYRGIQYGEYVPTTGSMDKKALVIWLHGAGEGGDDNYIDLLGNEVTALASEEFQKNFKEGAYVITPQCDTMWMDGGDGQYQNGEKGSMYADDLFALIEKYVRDHKDIDPDRIIIGGCSNGGYMTMEMVLKHPDYFYKAYPICEAYSDENITDEQIAALKKGGTQFWFTYAKNDTTVDPTKTSIPTIERMKKAGITVHTSVWDDVHDTTGRFTNPDGTPYQYAGHWSWIYFDNNMNTCDDCEKSEWVWLGETDRKSSPPTAVTGSATSAWAGMIPVGLMILAGIVVYRKQNG
ncbi:MAG: prolyl oligopeptidase family serine peptidase [Bulleidia sp.]